ncbi:unnamed protein product [Meganyctiphanes norvegica]|uniref:Ubiquitin carboxyl-terminal hydrolase 39 n=1 Tax=Meganyctiphanes norvegica TaxID=48144 RepID=A0AAV2SQC2_MEGNR
MDGGEKTEIKTGIKRSLRDEVIPDPKGQKKSRTCPYLDTINRHMLDFDFEKLCSVSLSRINVYACLVCGKYFQGRGPNTHAYIHSVSGEGHHVYLNLLTFRFYCLPDNYEIIDSSLNDIIFVVNPTFTQEYIKNKVNQSRMSRAYDATHYLPGVGVGLNNIKANDYCNVVLQALSNIEPLRNYFLDPANYAHIHHAPGTVGLSMFPLVTRFGELVRKLWNPRNFKAHVSPHEMLQAVVSCSKKKFQFTKQGDAIQFLSWMLNSMHIGLKTKKKSTIINRCFRGTMNIYSQKILPVELEGKERERELGSPDYQERVEESPFLYLTCDLPIPPLFRDEKKENIIPQVSLFQLLNKFDGKTGKEYQTYKENIFKRFAITKFPTYLILYHKRFTKNTFYIEKNPTIVNFPVKNIDFKEYLSDAASPEHIEPIYDLVANIVHDGQPVNGTYRCHILHKGTGKWYEFQDLHVKEIEPQMLSLTESYIQIFEIQKPQKKSSTTT